MTRNVGTADRTLRLVAGILLILLPLVTTVAAGTPWLWWAMMIAGVVMLVTGLTRSCPLYTLIGVKTCRVR